MNRIAVVFRGDTIIKEHKYLGRKTYPEQRIETVPGQLRERVLNPRHNETTRD